MTLLNNVVFVSLLLCASTQKNNNRDAIGFPESEENPDIKNKDMRIPVYIPARCPVNELFYPGDQKDDWICDCRPSFLYHPASDACWPAYLKGPCAEGEYLILKSNSDVPVCEKNPCFTNGFVSWNGKCERLGQTGPCNFMHEVPSVLGVNATTLVVSCVRLSVSAPPPRTKVNPITTECPPGCKRSINGKCVSST